MPRSVQLRTSHGTQAPSNHAAAAAAQLRIGRASSLSLSLSLSLSFIEGQRTAAKHQHVHEAGATAAAPGSAASIARLPPTHGGPPRRPPSDYTATDRAERPRRTGGVGTCWPARQPPGPARCRYWFSRRCVHLMQPAAAAGVASASWWNASLPLMLPASRRIFVSKSDSYRSSLLQLATPVIRTNFYGFLVIRTTLKSTVRREYGSSEWWNAVVAFD